MTRAVDAMLFGYLKSCIQIDDEGHRKQREGDPSRWVLFKQGVDFSPSTIRLMGGVMTRLF